MSRRRPEIKLKGEALFPYQGNGASSNSFDPRRDGEEDYEAGLVFNVRVGPKVALALIGLLVHVVFTTTDTIVKLMLK